MSFIVVSCMKGNLFGGKSPPSQGEFYTGQVDRMDISIME
jgi:hypothetical protein